MHLIGAIGLDTWCIVALLVPLCRLLTRNDGGGGQLTDSVRSRSVEQLFRGEFQSDGLLYSCPVGSSQGGDRWREGTDPSQSIAGASSRIASASFFWAVLRCSWNVAGEMPSVAATASPELSRGHSKKPA